jgi:hypothetical protein
MPMGVSESSDMTPCDAAAARVTCDIHVIVFLVMLLGLSSEMYFLIDRSTDDESMTTMYRYVNEGERVINQEQFCDEAAASLRQPCHRNRRNDVTVGS